MSAGTVGKNRYRAPALEKGLDILEVLASSRLPLSQVDIAKTLGRSQGEIFRMLTCLEERGYIIREAESGQFKLTLRLYEIGHKQNATNMLRNAARVPMEELAEQEGQACHLSVQFGSSLLVLMERMPSRKVCLAVGEGTTLPMIETSSGRLLLSQLSHEEIKAMIATNDVLKTKPPRESHHLLKIIEKIRETSYVIAESNLADGVTDVASTVGILGTDVFGVIAISFLNPAKKIRLSQGYLQAIRKCASQVNRNLGMIE